MSDHVLVTYNVQHGKHWGREAISKYSRNMTTGRMSCL